METTKNGTRAIEQDHLNLLEKLLRREDRPERKRRQVLNYCREHFVSESKVWRELCLLREAEPAGILFGEEPLCVFDYADEKLRERILALINKLPVGTLSDFRELTILTDNFRDRVKFLSDLVLGLFLDREKDTCTNYSSAFPAFRRSCWCSSRKSSSGRGATLSWNANNCD